MRNNQTNCQKRGKRRATKSWLISVLLLIGRAGGASFLRQSQSELKQNRYNLFWNVLDDKLFSSFTDCSLGLGMITGDIRDSQITASSSYSEWTQPFAGRLWNTRWAEWHKFLNHTQEKLIYVEHTLKTRRGWSKSHKSQSSHSENSTTSLNKV